VTTSATRTPDVVATKTTSASAAHSAIESVDRERPSSRRESVLAFDAIYSNCFGWPDRGSRDVEAFKAYIRTHELRADVYYRAYPRATVRQVKAALKLKTAMNGLLNALNE
jgi:hypothetical protein